MPSFVKARESSRQKACIGNLMQIDGAKHQFAMDEKKSGGDAVAATDIYGVTKFVRTAPKCSADGTYTIGVVGDNPVCTISGHGLPPDE